MLRLGEVGVTDPIWVEYGRWLREIREKASLSLEQVEEGSAAHGRKVTKSYLSRAELGEYLPDLDRLQTLARLYGYTLPDMVARYESLKLEAEAAVKPIDRLKDYDDLIREATETGKRGNHAGALDLFCRARQIATRFSSEPKKELDALLGIGGCLAALGRAKQARSIAEDLIARGREYSRLLSSAIHLLALSYSTERRHEIAIAILQGFRGTLGAGPHVPRARALLTLCNCYRETGHPDEALRTAQRALTDYRNSEEPVSPLEIAQAHYTYGQSLAIMEKFGPALEELARARGLYHKYGAEKKVALTYIEAGETYYMAQHFPAARRYMTRGVRLARRCGALDLLLMGYCLLWQLETRLEHHDLAESHKRMAKRIRRRVPEGMPLLRGVSHLLLAMERSQ